MKCIEVDNALIYAQNRNKKASLTPNGDVYLEKRNNIIEDNPYQTCVMLEK